MKTSLSGRLLVVFTLLVAAPACITYFPSDASVGEDGGSGGDGGTGSDAAGSDAASSDSASGVDTRTGTDAASGTDSAAGRDSASGTDTASTGSDAASSGSDAGPPRDAATVVYDGGVPVGEHCETQACADNAMCIGNSSNAVCRLECAHGGTDCNGATEYCANITLPDGGPAATGACLPGQGENQSCVNDGCAEVYTCAYQDTPDNRTCRVPCAPSAADAGCPGGQQCLGFTNQDAGACF